MVDASIQSKGGRARAAKLTPAQRSAIAASGARARWRPVAKGKALKPATMADVYRVELAVIALRTALKMLTTAGCEKSAEKVRKAITSTDGALRHVQRRARAGDPS